MLSIIIVNYKTSAEIAVCLQSIVQHEKNFRKYEIVIVDNDSHDDGLENISRSYSFIKILRAPRNGGFAYANNIGINNSSGEYILLLNPDTYIQDNSIEKLYDRIRNDSSIDIIGPQLLNPDGTNQSLWTAKSYQTLWKLFCVEFFLNRLFRKSTIFNSYFQSYMEYNKEKRVEHVPGAAIMFRRELINKIGLLDEHYFMYFEESDFCLQAVKNGRRLLYYPGSRIIHTAGQSTSSGFSEKSNKYYIESFIYYYKKNFGLFASYLGRFILFTGSLVRFVIYLLLFNKKYKIYYYYLKYLMNFAFI